MQIYFCNYVQLQQYKISGYSPKALEDKPKENGQTDESQQQTKVFKKIYIFPKDCCVVVFLYSLV